VHELSVIAVKDDIELVAKLRAYHHSAQTKADKKIRNNLEVGLIELAMRKFKIIQVCI